MKKYFSFHIIGIFFILFIPNIYSQTYDFVEVATNSSDCIGYTDNYDALDRNNKYFLINPEGQGFGWIRVCLKDYIFTSEDQGVILYGYDPSTNTVVSYITCYDKTMSDEELSRPILVKDVKAILISFLPDPTQGGGLFDLCYEAVNITEASYFYSGNSGLIYDGSGSSDYSPNIKYKYFINTPNSDFVELTFTNFVIGYGDDITVYDGESENYPILGTFSKTNWPGSKISSTTNKMLLVFNTDGSSAAAGWSAEYLGQENRMNTLNFYYNETGALYLRTINLGSRMKSAPIGEVNRKKIPPPIYKEKVGEAEIKIYPNPTKGELKVEITGYDLSLNTGIQIYNLSGKLIKQLSPVKQMNIMDLSQSPVGTYVMRIAIGDKISEWKIVKE